MSCRLESGSYGFGRFLDALAATNLTTACYLLRFSAKSQQEMIAGCVFYYSWLMLRSLKLLFVLLVRSVRSRRNLLLENLALRQQLAVLKQKHPQPRLAAPDKLFWVILRRLWPG
jgi:hypothetical protein